MAEGPDIALIGSMIGDPARANMLAALMSGKALTATELATEGGITAQTASVHLAKMETAGLLIKRKQGRHRYFELAIGVGTVLENIMGLAASIGHIRTRTGPTDKALRKARVCYDHLAGDYGILVFDGMVEKGYLAGQIDDLSLTSKGEEFVKSLGINLHSKPKKKRPICLACLDWSARRSHLAGLLGAELLKTFEKNQWIKKSGNGSRVITVTAKGEREIAAIFG